MKRLTVLAVVPLLFTVGLLGLSVGRASAVPRRAQPAPSQSCILVIICTGSSPTPSSPGTPSPSGSPSPSASGSASPPAPAPSAGPTVTPSGSASATPSASGTASPTGSGTASPTGSPSPSPTGTPHRKRKAAPKDGTVAPGLVASSVTWTMTVDSATMTGFTYLGNVNMPVAGGGTVLMMEFRADSMDMSGATTLITENGQTGKETDAAFTASGATLYATRLSGTLIVPGTKLGVPVTFTPSTASAVFLSIANLITAVVPITMTGVTADQTVITAAQAQKTDVAAVG